MCIDYRKLNAVTIPDAHPIPPISQTIDALAEAKYFCALDLSAGYMNVQMDESSRDKTAFVTRSGLYEYTRMSFGLINAPSTFQRLMEYVLHNCHWSIAMVYLDDILVYGKTIEETMANLEEILKRLEAAGLKLKPKKCKLFKTEVLYLGYIIGRGEVKTNPDKVKDIMEFQAPKTDKEVRRYLGLTGYYRKFVKGYANIAHPLNRLLNKGVEFRWGEKEETAFQTLKDKLVSAPILSMPSASKEDRYILTTDASQASLGAILSQLQKGEEKVIAYSSKTLSKCERNYCITRKELLSIVYHVNHYRMYLLGTGKFLVKTDHKALKSLFNFKDMNPQLSRWMELLSSFEFEIEYVPGTKIQQADFMSRCSGKQCFCTYSCSDPCSEDFASKPCQLRPVEEIVRQLEQQDEEDHIDLLNDEIVSAIEVDDEEQSKEPSDKLSYPWTITTLKEAQNSDKELKPVIDALTQAKKPKFSEVASESELTKALLAQWTSMFVLEGILYRKFTTQANEVRDQVVVPKVFRKDILRYFHDNKMSGHFAAAKVYKRIHRRHYWPFMQRDIEEYVRSCLSCQRKKNPKRFYCAHLQKYVVGNCFERVGMDLLGPLPLTYEGNKYVLVIADYFSKWVEAYAVPDQSAEATAEILCSRWITLHGCPFELFTDAGSNFRSKLIQEICRHFEIAQFQAIVRNPASNGFIEIINFSLSQMLSKIDKLDPHNWDTYLPYLSMAMRSTDHCSTGVSANKIVFGREIMMPYEAVTPREASMYECTVDEYAVKLRDRLASAHETARNTMQKMFKYREKAHNSRLRENKYKLRDAVFYWAPVVKRGQCKKLLSFWKGPFYVVQVVSDVVYRIQGPEKNSNRIVHHNQLKPAFVRDEDKTDLKWLDKAIEKFSRPKPAQLDPKTTAVVEPRPVLRRSTRNRVKTNRFGVNEEV